MIIDINKLKLNQSNPRFIKDDKFKDLVKSLKNFPKMLEQRPIVVDENMMILGGNMRLKACQQAGIKKVPISIAKGWTEEEKREFIIKDNLAYGEWDWDILANEWKQEELEDWGMDLPTNWGTDEVEEDEAPEVGDEPAISKLGEIYQLGKHRLMCGDSTKNEDIEKLMDEKKAKLLFTSPPYNMNSGMYENYEDNLKSNEYIKFNLDVVNSYVPFLRGFLFWNVSYNKNARWEFLEIMYKITKETGLRFLEMIVWDKGHGMPITSKEMITRQYEDILVIADEDTINQELELFYVGGTEKRAWFNKKNNMGITNYWKVDTNKTQLDNHKACYPVNLPAKAIRLTTDEGDIIIDPFGGSGTNIIACEQLNRKCYMMELDPKYCDVIRKRYHKFVTSSEDGWEQATPKINE